MFQKLAGSVACISLPCIHHMPQESFPLCDSRFPSDYTIFSLSDGNFPLCDSSFPSDYTIFSLRDNSFSSVAAFLPPGDRTGAFPQVTLPLGSEQNVLTEGRIPQERMEERIIYAIFCVLAGKEPFPAWLLFSFGLYILCFYWEMSKLHPFFWVFWSLEGVKGGTTCTVYPHLEHWLFLGSK